MARKVLLPQRRSIRLHGYDYRTPGFYFVTICTHQRKCHFGTILRQMMHVNDAGQIAKDIWESLPQRFSNVGLDQYIIMPNHLHGIIILKDVEVLDECGSGISDRAQRTSLHVSSLAQVVRTYKGAVTYSIRRHTNLDTFSWQGRYYETILRTDHALDRARQYILDNPINWGKDSLCNEG